MTSRSNTQRATTLVFYQGAIMLMSIGVGVMTARLLGVFDRGVYVLAFLPGQLLASLAASPLSDALLYFSARDEDSRPQVLRSALVMSMQATAAVLAALAGLWLVASSTVLKGVPPDVYLVACIATPCYVLVSIGQTYAFSIGRTGASQVPQTLERVVSFIAIAAVFALDGSLMTVVIVSTAAFAISALAALRGIGRAPLAAALAAAPDRALSREMIVYARRDFWGTFAQKLTYRFDQLILNVLAGPAAVGLYGVAARLADVPLVGPRALRTSWFASRSGADDARADADVTIVGNRKLILLMSVLIVPFGALGALMIPFAYGEEFRPAVEPFLILLAATLALSSSFAFVSALAGSGAPHRVSAATFVGLAVTLVLDLLLIPRFGATGAAMASALAYLAFTAAAIFFWRREIEPVSIRLVQLIPRPADARALMSDLRSLLRRRRTP